MIASFADKETEKVFKGEFSKAIPAILAPIARDKLIQLDRAVLVQDMATPPGNRLEKLKGDRKDQWSIRINQQYRICFYWDDETASPWAVEIVDYH